MKKFLLALLFLPIFVQAESRGLVAGDCGKFIEDDKTNAKDFKFAYKQSFLAYLSALEQQTQQNKLTGVSTDAIYYSVLQICKQKPRERLDGSLLKLYFKDLK